ncbi:MAG: hypothetical protein HGA36_02825, partial [Candidatus Moranbacteria bacterium]|nr:hypothetical protein [Candidatus Moranbacteria bacterium]
MTLSKNTIKNIFLPMTMVSLLMLGALVADAQVVIAPQQQAPLVDVSAYVVDNNNQELKNGQYDVSFSFYDGAADGTSIWNETQKIQIENGIINAYLGDVNPFPAGLTFGNRDYYLGIKIGTDSEMTPRKKVGAVPTAVNTMYLQGKTVGNNQGDILQLGVGGKIDASFLPVGTASGDLVQLNADKKIDIAFLPTGTGSNQLMLANDSRLKNIKDLHAQNSDTGTSSLIFNLGNKAGVGSNNFGLTVGNGGSKPTLRYNGSLGQWQYSNDGATFTGFGAGAPNFLDAADGLSGTVSSFSGLELRGNDDDKLTLLQGCFDNQVLAWNSFEKKWKCTTVSGVAGMSGTGNESELAIWGAGNTMRGQAISNDVNNILIASDYTAIKTLLGLGALAVSGTVDNTSWAGNALAIANGGTGANTVAAARTNLGIGSVGLLNSITLSTNTTGNYLDFITGGSGMTVTGSAGHGATPTLSVNLLA